MKFNRCDVLKFKQADGIVTLEEGDILEVKTYKNTYVGKLANISSFEMLLDCSEKYMSCTAIIEYELIEAVKKITER